MHKILLNYDIINISRFFIKFDICIDNDENKNMKTIENFLFGEGFWKISNCLEPGRDCVLSVEYILMNGPTFQPPTH